MQRETTIQLEQAGRTYQADGVATTALHPADLTISKGEFVCLAGPSGSGKTTLLNLMGGIDLPSTGRVLINGRPTAGLGRTAAAALRRENIGFVFQAFNLIPVLTAYENVEYILLLLGVQEPERSRRVQQALAAVGLAGEQAKRPGELSGGQQQRVAVARAIVGEPPIVLADEPTGSLDSVTGGALLELFRKLNQEQQTTFVFSSHDPRIIERAHRIIRLEDGRLAEGPTPGQAPGSPKTGTIFFSSESNEPFGSPAGKGPFSCSGKPPAEASCTPGGGNRIWPRP